MGQVREGNGGMGGQQVSVQAVPVINLAPLLPPHPLPTQAWGTTHLWQQLEGGRGSLWKVE